MEDNIFHAATAVPRDFDFEHTVESRVGGPFHSDRIYECFSPKLELDNDANTL
jgi:hypothetical protein